MVGLISVTVFVVLSQVNLIRTVVVRRVVSSVDIVVENLIYLLRCVLSMAFQFLVEFFIYVNFWH